MNDQHDHDIGARDVERRLAAFLGDDTAFVRAPERAIEGAMAHARAHPRRRDVLAAVRPDPMDGWLRVLGLGGPGSALGVGRTAPRLVLVASLGLLLVAALAVASVGGFLDRPSVVPPDGSPSPLPSVVPSPSVAPSVAPSPTAPPTLQVDLTELYGSDAAVEITDASGTLVSAVSGTPQEGGSTDGTSVVVTQGASPETLVLTWTGLPCTTGHTLTIAADGRSMAMTQPACDGDTIPRDLVLELTFADPVDAVDVVAMLETVE